MTRTSWGIDLGGTKIEGVILNGDSNSGGGAMSRIRIATESSLGYEHIIQRVGLLVRQMSSDSGLTLPTSIGIGTPGARNPNTGKMKNCNTTCLNGNDLKSDLENELQIEVRLANDADCFALAEARYGAGRGFGTVFGVIIGTGVGGGIVVDGRLISGPNGLSGEWGHIPYEEGGHLCYCGNRGCIETYLSGPSVERMYESVTGKRKPLAEIASQAGSDGDCSKVIDTMATVFGFSIAKVVNILDPDVIILGGGAGQIPQLRTLGRERAAQKVFGGEFCTPIVLPELGDSAGVFGAALLVAD